MLIELDMYLRQLRQRVCSLCAYACPFSCEGILRTLSLGHHKHCTCMPHYMTLCIDGLYHCFLFPSAYMFLLLCVLETGNETVQEGSKEETRSQAHGTKGLYVTHTHIHTLTASCSALSHGTEP